MTPERRDDAVDDDDDAGNDGAHLSATFAPSPGLAASCSRAASIPALCASHSPFGTHPLLAFPLDEGFDQVFEDQSCCPCDLGV